MESRKDVIIVGGGVAGSSLGIALARRGVRTLILEREHAFRDRVRGEQLQPWGVSETRRLGIPDLIREGCGHQQPYFIFALGGQSFGRRDLQATTKAGEPGINFYHPELQEVLLRAAFEAGAEVRRGATVRRVQIGGGSGASGGAGRAHVTVEQDGSTQELSADLVVGADGRNSFVRREAGFETRRDPGFNMICGILAEGLAIDEDSARVYCNPAAGRNAAVFPQGRGRARAYLIYPESEGNRFQGEKDIPRFVAEALKSSIPPETFAQARFSGPLASFECADTWVDGPYRDGVALIGDAAASSDPAWGQGLCLSFMDARLLSEALLNSDDWEAASREYAAEHNRRYQVMHEVTSGYTEFFNRSGPEADAVRARALPRIGQDPTRVPDHLADGPELPWGPDIRRRFFGED